MGGEDLHPTGKQGIERRMVLRVPKKLAGGEPGETPVAPLDHAQEFTRLVQFWKAFFFCEKFARVHASPAPSQPDWVLQVQHLVKQNVFDRVARHARAVEDAADDDGVVRGIIVAEAPAGVVSAPGELGTSHESVEEAAVEVVEDFFQMVVMAAGGADMLASADLADEARFGGNVVAGDIAAITGAVGAIDGLTIKLGEQDVGDRV